MQMVKPSPRPIIVWSIHPRARQLLQQQLLFRTNSLTEPPTEQQVLSNILLFVLLLAHQSASNQIILVARPLPFLSTSRRRREHKPETEVSFTISSTLFICGARAPRANLHDANNYPCLLDPHL